MGYFAATLARHHHRVVHLPLRVHVLLGALGHPDQNAAAAVHSARHVHPRNQFENVASSSISHKFILTFIVVFVFFSVSSPPRIGLAYMVALCCSLIRALGSAAPPAEQHHLHNPSVCSCPVRGKVGQGAGSWHLGTLDQSNSGQTYNQRPDTSVANLTCVHLTAEEVSLAWLLAEPPDTDSPVHDS